MSNYEHCCECNERTGRAGPSDDSLYLGSVGPFCEDCVDTWPDKMTEEYGRLMAMNAELTEEIELLQHALSWKGKMLSAIVNITKGPPEENTLHSTHDAVESVERLQARVASLECSLWEAEDPTNPDAFILRKQAEAVEYEIISLCGDLRKSKYRGISVKELLHESVSRSSKIRNEAKKFDDQ